MRNESELMCLECGISIYLPRDLIVLESFVDAGVQLVRDPFCTECGGKLRLIGGAGNEPYYRLQEEPGSGDPQAK
ncbi:MAG TPA: hypothetical protein DCE18_15035 [Syntrophobacteraceae bacterium]|nr:hypothetical protein [Syntrophobacteraceae bacterium]HBZ57398.1 hypothetical protein [Syntrophobacteraceae bacterium]